MNKKIINTLFILIGIIGIIMALMSVLGSLILGGIDTTYDNINLFLGAFELVGSILALILSARLKQKTAVMTGIVFLLLGAAFAASAYMFQASIHILPAGICILAGLACFFGKKYMNSEQQGIKAKITTKL